MSGTDLQSTEDAIGFSQEYLHAVADESAQIRGQVGSAPRWWGGMASTPAAIKAFQSARPGASRVLPKNQGPLLRVESGDPGKDDPAKVRKDGAHGWAIGRRHPHHADAQPINKKPAQFSADCHHDRTEIPHTDAQDSVS